MDLSFDVFGVACDVFRRSKCRWNLTETDCKCVETIEVAQKRSLMNAVEHNFFLRS